MSKTRVEIWMGGMSMPTYTIHDPQRVYTSEDQTTVRIIGSDGWKFETSPHNVVMIIEPEEKK